MTRRCLAALPSRRTKSPIPATLAVAVGRTEEAGGRARSAVELRHCLTEGKATADAHRELLLRDDLLYSHGIERTKGRERCRLLRVHGTGEETTAIPPAATIASPSRAHQCRKQGRRPRAWVTVQSAPPVTPVRLRLFDLSVRSSRATAGTEGRSCPFASRESNQRQSTNNGELRSASPISQRHRRSFSPIPVSRFHGELPVAERCSSHALSSLRSLPRDAATAYREPGGFPLFPAMQADGGNETELVSGTVSTVVFPRSANKDGMTSSGSTQQQRQWAVA
nr:hypothetical protein Iba_chr01aCG4580 [Ipomoea batatas]GME18216.1 hypothetical protein Iba_scaffold20176CG0010 [Ipomoea batatas]